MPMEGCKDITPFNSQSRVKVKKDYNEEKQELLAENTHHQRQREEYTKAIQSMSWEQI